MTHNDTDRRETVHRAVRVLVVAWLAVMLLAAPAVAQTETATPTQTAPCATGPPVPGQGVENDSDTGDDVEVALVNDRSGSMAMGTGRIEALKNATTGFIDRLETPDEAAAVSFGEGASVDQGLTTDYQAVKDAINALNADDSTSDIDEGISTATDELTTGENADDGAEKAMVVTTDAEFDAYPTNGVDEADAAKAEGITIFAIGLGDQVDETVLQDISSGDRYYVSPDPEDLDAIYQEISGDVEDIGTVESDLEIDTRSLYQPGATHGYTVNEITYLSDNSTESTDVTDGASVTTTNTTLLSVNESGHTLSATDDANTSTWVRVDATYNGTEGCTNVIVAEPTVENLQLIPGIWRFYAILDDSTMFALLIATLLSVPAARYTSAFGGLAVSEMVIVGFWFAGYINYGFAAVSVFVAMFIGLNLAANIDYQVRR